MSANRITLAALQAFAYRGYEGTALSEIARQVGMKTPSLYAHFRSKEELFLSAYDEVLRAYAHGLKQLLAETETEPVEQRLYHLLKEACCHQLLSEEKNAFLKRAILFPPAFLEEELRQRFMNVERELSEQVLQLFIESAASGLIARIPPTEALTSYYCLLDGCFMQACLYGRDLFEPRLPSVWSIFWRGLTAA